MDWVIVEVVIGLSFLFFLLSIVASAVNEAIAGIWKVRARNLEKGIRNLLTGSTRSDGVPETAGSTATEEQLPPIVQALYEHALVSGVGKDDAKPSYLSSRSFRNALLDITGLLEATEVPAEDPIPVEQIRARVDARLDGIENKHLRDALTTIWRSVERDATEFRAGVERWFDRGMERVSGWYKRWSQVALFVIGLGLAIAINASALNVADHLWKDDGLRQGLVVQLENPTEEVSGPEALDRLEELAFPVGWEDPNRPDGWKWPVFVLGWLLTAVAVTFGAPFWFDLLGKVSNLRAAGPRPASTLDASA